MSYTLLIHRTARKVLQNLSRTDRVRIIEKIMILGMNPDDETLDIKRLQGLPYHRLRVGDWRIIYERDDDVKIISIDKIKPRGDAYK